MGDIWKIKDQYKRQMGNLWNSVGDRGVCGGGSGAINVIDYRAISSTGDFADFGDLATAVRSSASGCSNTRGIFMGGDNPGKVNVIQYITITSTGNATDFGDMTVNTTGGGIAGCSNQTRMIALGGENGPSPYYTATIEQVTIAATGTAADFGNGLAVWGYSSTANSPTRAIWAGGVSPSNSDVIQHTSFSSNGNTIDFGDLTTVMATCGGCSNSTKGLTFGGSQPSASTNQMNSYTIATLGDATDFGNMVDGLAGIGGTSNSTRGLQCGGNDGSNNLATVGFVQYASLSDAVDFGDLSVVRGYPNTGACSQAHGGLLEGEPRPLSVGSGRGIHTGGATPTKVTTIDLIHIPTLGNSSVFGDLTVARGHLGSASSTTRGLSGAGNVGPYSEVIDSFEIQSRGNAADFGNLTVDRSAAAALSSSTRAIWEGGYD